MNTGIKEIKLKVEFKDHLYVVLTNANGDTYTSKSEELQDFLFNLPEYKNQGNVDAGAETDLPSRLDIENKLSKILKNSVQSDAHNSAYKDGFLMGATYVVSQTSINQNKSLLSGDAVEKEQDEDIKKLIEDAALLEEIYEPKYGGKDHSGYNTMMLYEINSERSECFEKGAWFGYNLKNKSEEEQSLKGKIWDDSDDRVKDYEGEKEQSRYIEYLKAEYDFQLIQLDGLNISKDQSFEQRINTVIAMAWKINLRKNKAKEKLFVFGKVKR